MREPESALRSDGPVRVCAIVPLIPRICGSPPLTGRSMRIAVSSPSLSGQCEGGELAGARDTKDGSPQELGRARYMYALYRF